MRLFLFQVFGKRVAILFGAVSFLFVSVLASLYLMAGYAMQAYVADQVERVPWDMSAGQRDSIREYPGFQQRLRQIDGVDRVEAFGFLRVQNSRAVPIEVDGRESSVRWLAIIATSDPALLPPQLRAAPGDGEKAAAGPINVRATFVGSDDSDGAPFDIEAGSTIRLVKADRAAHDHHDHDDALISLSSATPDVLFEAKLANRASSIERQEFNKWMLRNVGSLSYLPEMAIVVAVPIDRYVRIAELLDRTFLITGGMHGGAAPPPYVPEVLHLVRLERDRWVNPWELGASLDRLSALVGDVLNGIREITGESHLKSDLYAMLARMEQVSRLTGVVTLLVAIPLLWLGWAVAQMLSALLLRNERRLMGLAIVRGVPVETISRVLIAALVLGGLAGGLLGLAAGIALPVLGQALAGQRPPPMSILLRGVVYFALFIGVGTVLAVFSGHSIIRRIRAMRPREAIAHIASTDAEVASDRPHWLFLSASTVLLLLGGAKFLGWTMGRPLLDLFVAKGPYSATVQYLYMADALLNFVAVPFFLFGLMGLLRWRARSIQLLLSAVTAPLAGKLRWFVADHMALNRQRVAGTLFIASLAMSLALLPQVAADTFYDRIVRGVQASVGADLQLEFDLAALSASGMRPLRFVDTSMIIQSRLGRIDAAIRSDGQVMKVALVQQYIAPEVFLPNQAGLFINLIDSPEEYLETVYREEGLGVSRGFADIVGDFDSDVFAASAGFLNVRSVPLDRQVALGYDGDVEVPVRFTDVLAFLPGQPTSAIVQREGYAAAEVDYLNYLLGNDARVVTGTERFRAGPLSTLEMLPSRAVFLIRTKPGASEADIQALVRGLPMRPQNVRWLPEEQRRTGRDMFISLALANMHVFMIGGLILSVAGVVVVGLANFLSERRTFSLLRLRGLSVSTLVRVSLSIFLAPVVTGILVGVALGVLAGLGISEAIWQLPRIYGVAGLLEKRIDFSATAAAIVLCFGTALLAIAMAFAFWPFRQSANENFKET